MSKLNASLTMSSQVRLPTTRFEFLNCCCATELQPVLEEHGLLTMTNYLAGGGACGLVAQHLQANGRELDSISYEQKMLQLSTKFFSYGAKRRERRVIAVVRTI